MKIQKLFTTLAAGFFLATTLAPLAHGQSAPYAWGWGFYGQMGNNSALYFNPLPVAVSTSGLLAGKTVVALAAGGTHTLALCSDGTVTAWGAGNQGQIGSGQVGNNSTPTQLVPVAVSTAGVLSGKIVTAISAGYEHSLALCSDGTVAAWGWNLQGELGDDATNQSDLPVGVNTAAGISALSGKTVTAIAAGDSHNLALCSDGTVVAWGAGTSGQLGNGSSATNSPVPVTVIMTGALTGKTVVAIAAGNGYSLALCSDGTIAAWGVNNSGQLGNNSTSPSLVPVAVNTISGISALYGKTVTAIAAGEAHGLALCSDGTVAAWGAGSNGQLGNNSISQSQVPVSVNTAAGSALYGKTVLSIAAGEAHSLARCADGSLAAWGWDFHGELGDDNTSEHTTAQSLIPVTVITTEYCTAVFTGSSSFHSLAFLEPCAPAVLHIAQYAGITLTGSVGCTYQINYTTNLSPPVVWTPLSTNMLTSTNFLFLDTNVIAGSRFYEAVLQ